MSLTSIFGEEDLLGSAHLDNQSDVHSCHIRGPYPQWTISGDVTCGRYTSINGAFNARGVVRIGRYCALGRYVSLISGNHRTDMPNQQVWFNQRYGFKLPTTTKGPVEIGHNVWMGDKVNVLSGVQVGHGCVLAAGATVVKSVAPFSIVGGSPARVLKKRFTQCVIDQLLEIQWWNWDDDIIAANKVFFETEIPPDADIDLHSLVVKPN